MDPLVQILARVNLVRLAEDIVARLRREVPAYGNLPDDAVRHRLRPTTLYNLSLFPVMISEGRELTEAELEPSRAAAQRDASEGVAFEELAAGLGIYADAGWTAVANAFKDAEYPLMLHAAQRFLIFGHQLSTCLAQTYVTERELAVSEQEHRHRVLIEALLSERPFNRVAATLAASLGVRRATPLTPFAVSDPAGTPSLTSLARRIRSAGAIAVTDADRVRGLAPAGFFESTLAVADTVYAIGEPATGAGLAASLEDLSRIVAAAASAGRTGQVDASELALEGLLTGSPELAESLADDVLVPLDEQPKDRGQALLETLATYVRCGLERKRTAKLLHVHPNTLDYRLKQVEQLTGLELANVEDLVVVTLALKQRELHEADR